MSLSHLLLPSIGTIWDHLGCFRPGNVPVLFPSLFLVPNEGGNRRKGNPCPIR